MSERVQIGGLSVAQVLSNLVADDIAPGTGIDATSFWAALETIIADLGICANINIGLDFAP